MNKKKLIAIVLVVAVALICGGIFLGSKEGSGADDVGKKNQKVLEEAAKGEDKLAPGVIASSEATYEQWLSAATVTAVSLTYPDFELEGIYAASETEKADGQKSKGVYVVFTSGGDEIIVESKPLDEERTEKGTVDLYEQGLGFATFDKVNKDDIDTDEMTSVDIDSLKDVMAKATLVSLYEHY